MQIDQFLGKLKYITTGAGSKPHKFILLLAVIQMIENGHIKENKIYYDDNLKAAFTEHFQKYARGNDRNRPYNPFFHLRTSGFWFLVPKLNKEENFANLVSIGGPKELLDNVDYAYLDNSVYQMLLNPEPLEIIKNTLCRFSKGQMEWSAQVNEGREKYIATSLNESLFQHEENSIQIIKNNMKTNGQLLNNLYLYERQTNNYYEYDIVLIGHCRLYVIELKHWSGRIQIAPYNWIIHGTQYRTDPHKINSFKCKILKGIYQHRFRTYPNVWVESIVVLTNPDAEVEGAHSPARAAKENNHNITFSSIGDLLTYIKKCDNYNHILDNDQIQNIADYLKSLNQPKPRRKYNISGYETVEYLVQRPESIELLARPIGPVARGLNRFRVFRAPVKLTGLDRERFMRRAYNTLNAVSQLKEHPNILKVWLVPNDEGDIIEGSDWSETGTLRDYIHNNGQLDADEVNNICFGIVQGLIAAHQNGIIHRAVNPENILLHNDVPKLMNFDLAYQLDENHITVIADIESLTDDGYIAPEVLLGQDIDESTDFFALGIIAYELFTGVRPFKKVRQFLRAEGGELSESALATLKNKQLPNATIEVIKALVQADRTNRIKDVNQILEAFSTDKTNLEPLGATTNAYLKPGDTYDLYEIIEYIGEGREAQIYKARNARLEAIALKLFNREIERERVFREGDYTSAIKSSYVVGCNNTVGHWNEDKFFLVLDYIDGKSMRSWINEHRKPNEDTFRNVATCLLQGVQAFHNYKDETGEVKTILHGDIKPDNILITKDGKAVLIDFGIAGPPRVDVFQGTLAYIPPDSLKGADRQFSEDGDLFALGISLWEWLCGQRPYDEMAIGAKPCLNQDCLDKMPVNLQESLMKAIALEREERFLKVEDMIKAFSGELEKPDIQITVDEEPEIAKIPVTDVADQNPFVLYLNSLSNASAGNENATAEAQIGNIFFPNIRVEHPVSQFIYHQLFTEKKHVILTGNAGDGKTTIAAEIYRHHYGKYKSLLPREESSDLVIIKDLSELPEAQRTEIFSEAMEYTEKAYLIVSNTGILIENLSKVQQGKGIEKSQLLTALEADRPLLIGEDRFLIVNIGRINSISAALSVGERILEAENWQKCSSCSRSKECPIFINVKLLQENIELVLERIGLAYRRLYEYGNRLTMRQMTGHLAYIITAGLNCEDVKSMSKTALEEQYNRYLFFNRFFGDDGKDEIPEAMQLLPVRKIREAELGTYSW